MDTTRSGRPAIGDTITLPGYGRCIVRSNGDPSVVVMETENGATLKVGEKMLTLMLLAPGRDARPTR